LTHNPIDSAQTSPVGQSAVALHATFAFDGVLNEALQEASNTAAIAATGMHDSLSPRWCDAPGITKFIPQPPGGVFTFQPVSTSL
jgi:hypothetical protein